MTFGLVVDPGRHIKNPSPQRVQDRARGGMRNPQLKKGKVLDRLSTFIFDGERRTERVEREGIIRLDLGQEEKKERERERERERAK